MRLLKLNVTMKEKAQKLPHQAGRICIHVHCFSWQQSDIDFNLADLMHFSATGINQLGQGIQAKCPDGLE